MTSITTPPAAATVELELENAPRSAGLARRAVDTLERHAHPETLAKARLLVTELVAARLAASPVDPLELRLTATDGRVRGELAGHSRRPVPPDGWSLLLVRRMSDAWGTREDGSVWFEVSPSRRRRRLAPAAS
jgi:hypothetical protein